MRPEALPVRGEIPEGGVDPLSIVVSFDVGEQVPLGGLAGVIGGVMDEFGFEGVEEALKIYEILRNRNWADECRQVPRMAFRPSGIPSF
jgi:hypothetical protein